MNEYFTLKRVATARTNGIDRAAITRVRRLRREVAHMVVGRAANQYVVIPPWSDEPIDWNPFDPNDLPLPDCAYLGGVLQAFESNSSLGGLRFYITANLDRLPSYGDDVIAIVISDEWCRMPRYADAVRAVFKTYGTRLPIHWKSLLRPSTADLAAFVQDLRTSIRRLPYSFAFLRRSIETIRRGSKRRSTVFTIPLGYYRQIAMPMIAVNDRRFDVYFAGSVTNRGGVSDGINRITPKFLSRAEMLKQLNRLATIHPNLAISTGVTPSFMQTSSNEAEQYSQLMMETKICLVPRGTSLETYRYFEGLRAGCVLVTERLPRHWFYERSPALYVRRWSELPTILPALIADPERLAALSHASSTWWSRHCSEDAIGRYLAEKLESLGVASTP